MNPRRTVTLFLALSTLFVGICGTALAGIEPSPWHTLISNRTDRLDSSSAFYKQNMFGMSLIVRVPGDVVGAGGTREIEIPIHGDTGGDLILAPGDTLAFAVDPEKFGLSPSAPILSWSFSARMGVEPSPWRPAFAFQTKLSVPPDPYQPPALAPTYLTGEMPILAFASPGVLVGTVQLVNDGFFYNLCPSIPPPGTAWKNHGQYVRCIARRAEYLVFKGDITQQEADAIVSAAARSETGK